MISDSFLFKLPSINEIYIMIKMPLEVATYRMGNLTRYDYLGQNGIASAHIHQLIEPRVMQETRAKHSNGIHHLPGFMKLKLKSNAGFSYLTLIQTKSLN